MSKDEELPKYLVAKFLMYVFGIPMVIGLIMIIASLIDLLRLKLNLPIC